MPAWSLTCEVPAAQAEDRAALLVLAGAGGVELREEGVAPMPGERRPAPGRAMLVAWFDSLAGAQRGAIAAGVDGAIAEVADRDWAEAWKRDLVPFAVGRVWVRPSWIAAPAPPGCAEVVLDPGMAFGTGAHPTTALCLEALSDLIAARPGASVLDVGTGSGLLAIAARKLGAGRVVGNDTDPVAVRVARENAARNGVELELVLEPAPAIPGAFDLVVANILANTLVELAPALAARLAPGGVLLLSGLLAGQEGEVRSACEAQGLVPERARDAARGEWRLVALRRPR
jgi:ribosomal protein L11 methyltransferase